MDTAASLRGAYHALLDAAAVVAGPGESGLVPPDGEWNADEILAHVSIVSAVTLAAVSAIAAGANTTYDNRVSQDAWTIEHTIELAGGDAGLRERIRLQAEALCALADGASLSKAELDTLVPTRLVSHDKIAVDQPLALRDLLNGLAESEIPGHTRQLQALRGD